MFCANKRLTDIDRIEHGFSWFFTLNADASARVSSDITGICQEWIEHATAWCRLCGAMVNGTPGSNWSIVSVRYGTGNGY